MRRSMVSRREFLTCSTRVVTGAAVGTMLASSRVRAVGANEKLLIGVIGIRGRGAGLAALFGKRRDVEIAYLCDVDTRLFADRVKAVEYVRSGKLGSVHFVKVFNMKSWPSITPRPNEDPPAGFDYDMWLGSAPQRPYNRNRHNTWNLYWDYSGGDIINDGVHQMDLARQLIGKEYPISVVAKGGQYFKGDQETPDTQVVTYEFDGLTMTFELTLWTPYMDKIAGDVRAGDLFPYWPQCATRIEVYGTRSVMYMGRHGGGWQVFGAAKKPSRPGELIAQEYGRVPEGPHRDNFIDCIRSRTLPNGDIREGHLSTLLCHLGNISYRLGGRVLKLDSKTETFVGDEEANGMLKRTYRSPYVFPEVI
jgi:hypothetical protein